MSSTTEPPLGASRSWIGLIFLFVATAWFAGVFWVMRPDQDHIDPPPTPIIKLPDGTTHRVYLPSEILSTETDTSWIEPFHVQTQYTYWEFVRRPVIQFLLLSMVPPAAVLFGALGWLGISEYWLRRRYSIRLED